MRRALLIGIDNYPAPNQLKGCVADVNLIRKSLEFNGDGTKNFEVEVMLNEQSGKATMGQIESLFASDLDVALLYFSGHGCENSTGSELVFPLEASSGGYYKGLQMRSIMDIVNQSKAKNKIIILDCCHAGDFGRYRVDIDNSDLGQGVCVLSACKGDENAIVSKVGFSIFTLALHLALDGLAADFLGNITIGSVYAYVDKFFSAAEQRPVFKTNVTEFIPLRKVAPKVPTNTIKELVTLFANVDDNVQLDPSFEFSNSEDAKIPLKEPYAVAENVEKMKKLQALARIGFVEPVGEEHMYYAAMNSKQCKLTSLGSYYWLLVKKGLV